MTGGNSRPLFVAGVAGGVGTSTWTRAFRSRVRLPVEDLGVFVSYLAGIQRVSGIVDVLVTSNTAAATARLGEALARCERPPLLVVMHTVPGRIAAARAYLRAAEPHVTRQFDVPHQQVWLGLDQPPGRYLPKDFTEHVRALPEALQEMYSTPSRSTRVHSLTPDIRGAVPAQAPSAGPSASPLAPPAGQQPGVRGLGAASWQQGERVPHARRSPGS